MKGLRRYSMTIFAFLTLKTASSAHYKIFGAKFLSFERSWLFYLYTASYKDIGKMPQKKQALKHPNKLI